MENFLTCANQKPATKKTKPKKKPIRVVYISNPMKVKTSASKFRALVQELTGQDSELPPDFAKYSDNHDVGSPETVQAGVKGVDDGAITASVAEQPVYEFDPFDDNVFSPRTLESISDLFPPPSFSYEYGEDVDVVRKFDSV